MICLLDMDEMPAVGLLTRFRRAIRGYKGVQARTVVVLGIKALHVTVGTPLERPREIHKRIQYAIATMRDARVGSVLFTKNFPYRDIVLREGFDEIDDGLLLSLMIGSIAARFGGRDKVAAFFADRLTGNAERAFFEMCRDFRYVMAAVETDGRLYAALSKSLGISVIGQPTAQQLLKADIAVFFSPPPQTIVLSDRCVVIPAKYDYTNRVTCRRIVTGLTAELGSERKNQIPEGFAQAPVLAAAVYAGTLRLEDIVIKDVCINDAKG